MMKSTNQRAVTADPNPGPAHPCEQDFGPSSMPCIVTTSWDDGDASDLRVAKMLADYSAPGTFYIPVKGHVMGNHTASRMSSEELVELASMDFEIGAHGIAHPNLPGCNEQELIVEIEGSKKRLEDDLSRNISMFAYPRGRHNGKVIAALIQAGFSGARTTAMLARELKFDPYRMPTSVHVFPHTRFEYFRNLARVWEIERAWAYATHFRCAENWVNLAKILFDSVLKHGGLWHLYGHSWEIEELGLWDGLSEVLDYVSHRPGVLYLANGPIVDLQTSNSAVAAAGATPAMGSLSEAPGVQTGTSRRVGI